MSFAFWRKCDFQVHSPRDPNWSGPRPSGLDEIISTTGQVATTADVESSRKRWASAFVAKCVEKSLQAVALTDHHEMVMVPYVLESIEACRRKDESIDLWLFPGMELTAKGGQQCLILFDANLPQKWWQQAQGKLGIEYAGLDKLASQAPSVKQLTCSYPSIAGSRPCWMKSRHEFEREARRHHRGRKLRSMSRWGQFVAMATAQLSGRRSLRDIVSNLDAQAHKLYHLGVGRVARSSLARVNREQPHELYEALFGRLLSRCQAAAPGHGFRFRNKLLSLDATYVDLCLKVFPWARYRKTKGALKLHVGLDHEGCLPSFLHVTDGKGSDLEVARSLRLPKGSIVAADRLYLDFGWLKDLDAQGVFLVTRLKRKVKYAVRERRSFARGRGVTSDQTIELTSVKGRKRCPIPLRRVGYRDPETGRHYKFLTNNFSLAPKTIADIYKARWQIELFFKWIKQNLCIKSFVGTSRNAVMTQIWIAICVHLLLAYLKFANKMSWSMSQILRLLQLNLFDRRPLLELLEPRSGPPEPRNAQTQLALR